MPPSKKQKAETASFFPSIGEIKYEGPDSTSMLAFKYYNAEEVVHGKKMKDWLRFAVCYWSALCGLFTLVPCPADSRAYALVAGTHGAATVPTSLG